MNSEKEELIRRWLDELYRWNRKINLTAVPREKAEEILVKPSLAMLEFFDETSELEIFDIGSGGGVPGMALAVYLPECRFHLVESSAKKCVFLKETAIKLGLDNVELLNERAEETAKRNEGCADAVTSRQVSAETVFPIARRLLKSGGKLILHHGPATVSPQEGFKKVYKNILIDCLERTSNDILII